MLNIARMRKPTNSNLSKQEIVLQKTKPFYLKATVVEPGVFTAGRYEWKISK